MRVFSQGQLAQGWARVLIVAFVWSALGSGIVAVPASAQVTTRSATAQSVAVVPFENKSAYKPETYGAEVAAAVAADLEQRLFLNVFTVEEVTREMKTLGLGLPMSEPALVRLGTQLEVNSLVWGEVREARVVMEGGERYGQVTLGVRLFDRVARADVNGALVTARSQSSAEASADDLIAKALEQAVFQAISEMKTRPTITAKVLWAKGDQMFSNTGTRGDVKPGMKMAAIRNGERIATVEITDADQTGCTGKVTSGAQLRQDDQLRAIYELPGSGPKPTIRKTVKSKARGLEKTAITVGALALLTGMSTSSRLLAEGDVAAPDFAASALANAMELGLGGGVVVNPIDMPVQLITWTKYSNTQAKRVAAYIIYRNDVPIEMVVPSSIGGRTYTFDDYRPPQTVPGCEYRRMEIAVEPTTGETNLVSFEFDYWDPEINDQGEYNPTYDDWHDGHTPQAIEFSGTDVNAGIFFEPATPGVRVFYRIEPVIITNRSNDPANPDWQFDEKVEVSTPGNFVTPVAPPSLDQAMLVGSVASFQFYQPIGADEMILQVARDRGDGKPVLWQKDKILERTISGLDSSAAGGNVLETIRVNYDDLQALPGTSDTYFWRVGARNRSDNVKPRPYPLTDQSEYGWVWSYPHGHIILTPSLGARAALQHQRETMDRALGAARMNPRTRPGNRPMHGTPRR